MMRSLRLLPTRRPASNTCTSAGAVTAIHPDAYALVWGFTQDLNRVISILIVACPCAMGLATPVALMAGVNAGTRRGILIRDGTAI